MTAPLSSITGLLKHPLTDSGLAQFLADYKKKIKGGNEANTTLNRSCFLVFRRIFIDQTYKDMIP